MKLSRFHLFVLATILLFIFSSFDDPTQKENKPVAEGTKKMVALLKYMADTLTPGATMYQNSQKVEIIRKKMKTANNETRMNLWGDLAYQLLQAGKTEEAIKEFEPLFKTIDSLHLKIDYQFYTLLGIAYMRLGEQQNCCSFHTSESCILPIQGTGLHKLPEGSEKAIWWYERILAQYPQDLQSRWLLNVAYMTLGKYPDGVPKEYLVPLEDSKSYPNFPHWKDVAPDAGLDKVGLAGGSCMEDFDNDGYLDIMSSSWGLRDQLRYYHNNGDGTFKNVTKEAGLTGIVNGLNIIHADYNNDGFQDVLVLRGAWMLKNGHQPNSLLKNNGDGTFQDVTFSSGLLSFHPTQTASWGDFNNDGYLDLFIGNESEDDDPQPCEFYLNNKDGTFTNIAHQMNMEIFGYVKGVTWGDINNDGLLDLYVSIIGMKNKLFLNKGGTSIKDWKFEDISESAGIGNPINSFPCWFFDYDNDGWEDIFASGYGPRKDQVGFDAANEYLGNKPIDETPHIYRNNRDNTFTDVTKELGFENRVCFSMGSNFGDLDNDGWLDFYLGTGTPDYRSIVPNRMFHNDAGKFFSEVTYSGGFGHIQKGHGVAWGDIDNDGDQDIFITIGGAVEGDSFSSALFRNPGNKNNWITLLLQGTSSTCNRNAIGARIKINVTESDDKSRDIYATCSTGGTFGSSSLQQEIGLGSAKKINSIEIIFPDGKNIPEVYKNVEMNKFYKAVQGKGNLDEVIRKTFTFGN